MGITYAQARKQLLDKHGDPSLVTDAMIRKVMGDMDNLLYRQRNPRKRSRRKMPASRGATSLSSANSASSRRKSADGIPAGRASGTFTPTPSKVRMSSAYKGPMFGPVKVRILGEPYVRPPLRETNPDF